MSGAAGDRTGGDGTDAAGATASGTYGVSTTTATRLGRVRSPSFGDRLAQAIEARGPVCVGIDPHPQLLADWGLGDDARGVRELALRVVDSLAGEAAAVKPQSAFFERHGSAGIAVLEEVLAAARGAGLLTVVDAKRGDIGSTMRAYSDTYLRDGSALAGDAVTLSPYLGVGALAPAIEAARASGRGVFVLCLTSNPQGGAVQLARPSAPGTASVAALVAREVAAANADAPSGGLGGIGLVVGATVTEHLNDAGVDLAGLRGPLLVPGYGAQGGNAVDVARVVAVAGAAGRATLVTTSRGVLGAGPDGLREATRRVRAELLAGWQGSGPGKMEP